MKLSEIRKDRIRIEESIEEIISISRQIEISEAKQKRKEKEKYMSTVPKGGWHNEPRNDK